MKILLAIGFILCLSSSFSQLTLEKSWTINDDGIVTVPEGQVWIVTQMDFAASFVCEGLVFVGGGEQLVQVSRSGRPDSEIPMNVTLPIWISSGSTINFVMIGKTTLQLSQYKE